MPKGSRHRHFPSWPSCPEGCMGIPGREMVVRSFVNFHKHDRSSKLVSCPQLQVINVAAGRRFFQKLPGIKNSVVGLKVRMSVNLPADLGAGSVPDESRATSVGRNEKKARYSVHTVL